MFSEKCHTNINDLFSSKPVIYTCAPMVRYSKLQFRTLVRQYNCDLVFTPMIIADSFCKSVKARNIEFTTNTLDTPLIVQFASNTVHDFVGASYIVSPFCDGVDLNCGCPQRWAKEMELGCEMLKKPQKIYELVRECRNRICKPFSISVKTRIQTNSQDNITLCQNLEKCGVDFITIHARTPTNNVGPIDEQALKLITEIVNIPVIGNGGLNTLENCHKMQEFGVKGVMAANGILSNPQLFTGSNVTLQCVQNWVNICFNSTLTKDKFTQLIENDVSLFTISERPYNLNFQCFHHHLVFMMEKILTRKQRQIFNAFKTFREVLSFLCELFNIKPHLFDEEHFLETVSLNLDYSDRDLLYNELKPNNFDKELNDYDRSSCNGKYFDGKTNVECDWSNIFDENG